MEILVNTIPDLLHLNTMRRNVLPLLLFALTRLLAPTAAQGNPNHLNGQAAPYLRRAIYQPVDWNPWGADAFRRAARLNRPVLLDVGALWCPWCTLMDRETYTNPATADYINQHFVAVKVDFDAAPALVAELQRAQAVLNLPAGLPLTSFITPGGKLYFGGTYFPRETKGDKPAFEDVLREALRMYREHRSEVERDGVDLNKEKGRVQFVIIDLGKTRPAEQQQLVKKYHRDNIPHVVVLDAKGNAVYNEVGEISESDISRILDGLFNGPAK